MNNQWRGAVDQPKSHNSNCEYRPSSFNRPHARSDEPNGLNRSQNGTDYGRVSFTNSAALSQPESFCSEISAKDVASTLLDQNFLRKNGHLLESILRNVDSILPTRTSKPRNDALSASPREIGTNAAHDQSSLRKGGARLGEASSEGGEMRNYEIHNTDESKIVRAREDFLKQREVRRWKEEQERIRREWEKQQIGEEAWIRREEDREEQRQRMVEEERQEERKVAEGNDRKREIEKNMRKYSREERRKERRERKEKRRAEEAGKSEQAKALEDEMRRFREEQLKKLDAALGRSGDSVESGMEREKIRGKRRSSSSSSDSTSSHSSSNRSRSRSSSRSRSRSGSPSSSRPRSRSGSRLGSRSRSRSGSQLGSRSRSRSNSYSRLGSSCGSKRSSTVTIDQRRSLNEPCFEGEGFTSGRDVDEVEKRKDSEFQWRSTAVQSKTVEHCQTEKEKKAIEVRERVARMQDRLKQKYQEQKDARQYLVEVEKLHNRTGQMAETSSSIIASGPRSCEGGWPGNWPANDRYGNNYSFGRCSTTVNRNGEEYHRQYQHPSAGRNQSPVENQPVFSTSISRLPPQSLDCRQRKEEEKVVPPPKLMSQNSGMCYGNVNMPSKFTANSQPYQNEAFPSATRLRKEQRRRAKARKRESFDRARIARLELIKRDTEKRKLQGKEKSPLPEHVEIVFEAGSPSVG